MERTRTFCLTDSIGCTRSDPSSPKRENFRKLIQMGLMSQILGGVRSVHCSVRWTQGIVIGVPAYGGGLFTSDAADRRLVPLAQISLPNNVLGFASVLLLVPAEDGVLGPVDFRSLGVREFGTIYEGLLESELSLADSNLTVETRGKSKMLIVRVKKVRSRKFRKVLCTFTILRCAQGYRLLLHQALCGRTPFGALARASVG